MSRSFVENKIRPFMRIVHAELSHYIREAGSEVEQGRFRVQEEGGEKYIVEFDEWVFKRCPMKHNSKKRCDVHVKGRFSCYIEGEKLCMLSYLTKVCWTTQKQQDLQPKLYDGYHFDMDLEQIENHPIFHAQRNPRHVAQDFENLICENIQAPDGLQSFRLPSAQLDFYSTLIVLLADHFAFGTEKAKFALILRLMSTSPLTVQNGQLGHLDRAVPARLWYSP